MKTGDLVRFHGKRHFPAPFTGGNGEFLGIWLGVRFTKWSSTHPFHRVLLPVHGAQEFFLAEDDFEVIDETR